MTTARAISRVEAVRLARRNCSLDNDLTDEMPLKRRRHRPGAPTCSPSAGSPVVAASVLHAWRQPDRIHSEAASAAIAGIAPGPASSFNTRGRRLNCGGRASARSCQAARDEGFEEASQYSLVLLALLAVVLEEAGEDDHLGL